MKLARYSFVLIAALALLMNACKKETAKPTTSAPANEEEVITTLRLTLIPQGSGDTARFVFTDLDGDGGNAPIITVDSVIANTKYNATVEFLNESKTPAEDITEEVKKEDDEHQVFYQIDANVADVTYKDMDGNSKPLGLSTEFNVKSAASSKLKVTLRHKPNKDASGVSSGDITNAGGETDIEVEFNFVVK